VKLPSQELREEAKKVVTRFMEWSGRYRDEHLQDIEIWNKHYRVEESVRSYDGRAHTADGSSHENVETIVPRLIEILTDNGHPKYEIAPVDAEQDPSTIKAPNAVIRSDMKMAQSRNKLIEACRAVVKYGTIVVRTPWERKARIRNVPKYVIKGVDEEGVYVEEFLGYEKQEEFIYEGVNWSLVDLKSCWIDPFTPDVNAGQGVVELRKAPFESLRKEEVRMETQEIPADPLTGRPASRAKIRRGHYFKDALDELQKVLDNQVVEQTSGDEKGGVRKENEKSTPNKEVNIKTYHGWFDYDGDGEAEDCIITLAGESEIVIQLEPSTLPRRPYIVCRYIALENQTYGLGVLGIMTKTQQMINDLQNQMLDDATLNLLPMWRRDPSGELQDQYMKYEPHKVWDAAKGELEPLSVGMQLRHGFDAINYAKENARQVTGASRSLQGMPNKYRSTATEVSSMVGESSVRIVLPAITIETELIVSLLEIIIAYNHEFIGAEGKLVRITNDSASAKEFLTVSKEDIAGQWDFEPLGASTYQRQMKQREELMMIMQMLGSVLPLAADPMVQQMTGMNFREFLKTLLATSNLPNLDRIFPEKPQGQMGMGAMNPMMGGGNGTAMPPQFEQIVQGLMAGVR